MVGPSPVPRRFTRASVASLLEFLGPILALAFMAFCASARAQSIFATATPLGSSAGTQSVSVAIQQSGSVGSILVLTQGVSNLDFQAAGGGTCAVGVAYPVGQSCTVSVNFKPVAPGQRLGAVVLVDGSGKTLGMQSISGLALGAIGTFVPGTITTVAGDKFWIYSGDGGLATSSSIFLPFGVVIDPSNNFYLADSANARIRKVSHATGAISTVAGNGVVGLGGDGGPATSANLSNPLSVALDGAGNLYVSDSGNNAVRRIDRMTGAISTVAGTLGVSGASGDGGLATAAHLNTPGGISFDAAGSLYIADTGNNSIRVVSAATGIITTIAGSATGQAGFAGDGGAATAALLNGPWSVTVSPQHQIYIADQNNNRIRIIGADGVIGTAFGTGVPGTLGDGGLASAAQLNSPANVAIDVAGNIYIADSGNNRVRKVNAQTGILTTAAGVAEETQTNDDGPATSAGLYGPYTLALDSAGDLFIADVFHNRIREVAANGATLEFNPIRVNKTSQPELQTLENDGNAAMTVTSVGALANAALDAPTSTCVPGFQLTMLSTCMIGASFAPTSTGTPIVGTMQLLDDAANSPGTLNLVGDALLVDPTAVSLASSKNPSTQGDTVTFAVVVTTTGTVTPTGTVTLLDGASALGTQTLDGSGRASFAVSTLTGGTHSMTAAYGGDNNNPPESSDVLTQVVQYIVAPTSTVLSSSANPVDGGSVLKLTATVTATSSGSGNGVVAGAVTFLDSGLSLGSAPVVNGTATLPVVSLAVGTHSIVATYGGSPAYSTSSSTALAQQVRLATTKTILGASANPSVGASPITLTATLTTSGGIPTGLVSFFDGTKLLGTALLSAQAMATLTLGPTALTVGTHSLTAVYAGDGLDAASSSAAVTETVSIAFTTTLLSASANPASHGSAVAFTAQVTAASGSPNGAVQFFDGTNSLGNGTLNATGTTTLSISTLTLGSHTITATYVGDGFNLPSTSAALAEKIEQGTTTSLTASAATLSAGAPLKLTAVVTGTASQPLTGTVRFLDGATVLSSVPIDPTGTATFSVATLAVGSHTLTAVYSGDQANLTSTSQPLLETITTATTTTVLGTSANPAYAGAALTLTASVTSSGGVPTGTVTFLDGTVTLGSIPLAGSGSAAAKASLTLTSLPAGIHSLTSSYAGDSRDGASLSPMVPEEVLQKTTLTLTSSANPSLLADNVTITAAVVGLSATSPATGMVTLLDGASAVATQGLSATGIATFTLTAPALGLHTLTATFSGDTMNSPAASPLLLQTVTLRPSTNTFTPSATNLNAGQTVTLTSAVVGNGPLKPTGVVTFVSGVSVVGTATLNANGVATLVLTPQAAVTWKIVAQYPGDGLYAASNAPPTTVTVGPTNQFTVAATPAAITLASGAHTTLTISIISAATFADTLAMGCAGLPVDATCTFSNSQMQVQSGTTQTLSVLIDTGSPLGAGTSASLPKAFTPGELACIFPFGVLAGLLLRRTRRTSRRHAGLFVVLLALGCATLLTGCANSLNVHATPAGSYTFRIIATGNSTGATQSGLVTMTVGQ